MAPDLTSVFFQTGEEEGTDHCGHANELGDGGLKEADEDQAAAHEYGSGDGSRELDREEAEVVGEDQIQGAAQEKPQAGGERKRIPPQAQDREDRGHEEGPQEDQEERSEVFRGPVICQSHDGDAQGGKESHQAEAELRAGWGTGIVTVPENALARYVDCWAAIGVYS